MDGIIEGGTGKMLHIKENDVKLLSFVHQKRKKDLRF